MAGFAPGEYNFRDDVLAWYTEAISPKRRDFRDSDERPDYRPAVACGAQQGDDGIWEISTLGREHLLTSREYREALMPPAIATMASCEVVHQVRAQLAERRDQAAAAYCGAVTKFATSLMAESAFASLTTFVRSQISNLRHITNPERIKIDLDALTAAWRVAVSLHTQVESGAILTHFGGHYRNGGATGQVDYWVIRPDGSLRTPTTLAYRKRPSEGEKGWFVVAPGELAITWEKGSTAGEHVCSVSKLPLDGCTDAQFEAVEEIERQLDKRFENARGMSGKGSPPIGVGWDLRPKPIEEEPVIEALTANTFAAAFNAKFGKK